MGTVMPQLAPRLVPGAAQAALQQQAALAAMPAPAVSNAPVFPTPTALPIQATQVVAAPSQKIADENELHRIQSTGSGVSQIQNPFLRGIARVADVAGAFIAPRLSQMVAGTTLHHAADLQRQQGVVQADQANEQADATLANTQAQEYQRQQLGDLEIAKATKALTPAPEKPESVAQQYSDAVADAQARGVDPSTDKKVQQLADAQTSLLKPPTLSSADKPIDAQEAASRNALWDALAHKHGLPTGQFTPGMTRAEANALAANLGTVVGKQQGDTHVTISMAGLQNQENKTAQGNNTAFDPAVVQSVANGSVKLSDVFGRGASTAQKAAFVAAVKQANPGYNSGDHDIENAVRKNFTSGQGATTLNAGNTLTHHLDLYEKAADAMKNGDVVALNRVGNELGIQLGKNPANNMQLIARGVASEAARFYTGGVPGEQEIEGFLHNLNANGSPDQMHGGAATVRGMARGKLDAMQAQYAAGTAGQPNFGNTQAAPKEGDVKTNFHGDKVKFSGGKWGPA